MRCKATFTETIQSLLRYAPVFEESYAIFLFVVYVMSITENIV